MVSLQKWTDQERRGNGTLPAERRCRNEKDWRAIVSPLVMSLSRERRCSAAPANSKNSRF